MGQGVLPVASTFTAVPLKTALSAALDREAIPQDLSFFLYGQMSEFMLRPSQYSNGATGALVLLRVEDWLRDDLKSAAPDPTLENQARQRIISRLEDFVTQLSVLTDGVPQVWVMVCPSSGWIATRHNLRTLCRTYGNVVTARLRKLPVTVLNCPPFLLNGECDDHSTDRLGQMPFTQAGFDQLGDYLAAEIKRTMRQTTSPGLAAADTSQFASYLASLNVQLKVSRPEGPQLAHVSRMLRTIASFSLTGEKPFLEDNEIERMLSEADCLLISVSDRLADYGPTGFALLREVNREVVVDAMALSCVVLGKQAEFAALSALSRYAAARGVLRIVFRFSPAARNQPMQEFLETVAENEPGVGYVVNLSDLETRIGGAAVKPGAWTLAFESSLDAPGVLP
jgi:hypothetical protein